MRIAYIVPEYLPRIVGGLGTYAQYMCPALTQLGHEVTVFTLNDGGLKSEERIGGIDVYRPNLLNIPDEVLELLPIAVRLWGIPEILLQNILIAQKLVDLVKSDKKQFDIIVVHDWLSGIAGMIARSNTGLPLVFHIHSSERGRAMGDGSHIISSIEWRTALAAQRIVTVSYAMYEDLSNQGFEAGKIRVCWNGIDTEKYDPKTVSDMEKLALRRRYKIKDGEKMLLFIGRLTAVKGAIELVEAMAMVEDPKVKLVVLGCGDQEGVLTDLIRSLGLEKRVLTRYEFVSENERIQHLAACDIAVFPSKYEPFGIVALEAMAMNKPAIVGACGVSGFKETVISSGINRTGAHVNGHNPADIFEWGIKPLFSLSDEELMEMGKRARERVQKHFTWEEIARQTAEIYAQAIRCSKECGGEMI